uniref:HDC13350 n=1 Tax=Drosophila melanogaster TaxID=7227 RepID=Q6IK55_DROME|nr:TPA_inf: HDC13350 [Drosophila melanogaster]
MGSPLAFQSVSLFLLLLLLLYRVPCPLSLAVTLCSVIKIQFSVSGSSSAFVGPTPDRIVDIVIRPYSHPTLRHNNTLLHPKDCDCTAIKHEPRYGVVDVLVISVVGVHHTLQATLNDFCASLAPGQHLNAYSPRPLFGPTTPPYHYMTFSAGYSAHPGSSIQNGNVPGVWAVVSSRKCPAMSIQGPCVLIFMPMSMPKYP